jgi:hypothetical protein
MRPLRLALNRSQTLTAEDAEDRRAEEVVSSRATWSADERVKESLRIVKPWRATDRYLPWVIRAYRAARR